MRAAKVIMIAANSSVEALSAYYVGPRGKSLTVQNIYCFNGPPPTFGLL